MNHTIIERMNKNNIKVNDVNYQRDHTIPATFKSQVDNRWR